MGKQAKSLVEMTELHGTYRGFAPTDESPIASGELEITITQDTVTVKHATGLELSTDAFPTTFLTQMPKEEIAPIYQDGSQYIDRSIGFWSGTGTMKWLFIPDAGRTPEGEFEHGLLIRGNEMADILGFTFGLSPKQVRDGLWQEMLDNLKDSGLFFPMLEHNGEMPPEYYHKQMEER